MTGLIDRNFLNSVSNFLVIYHLLSLKICKRGILLLYLTFIALEVKANCCLCLLPPSAVPGEVPISPLVHVPATVVLISKLATPLFERYLGRSHRGLVSLAIACIANRLDSANRWLTGYSSCRLMAMRMNCCVLACVADALNLLYIGFRRVRGPAATQATVSNIAYFHPLKTFHLFGFPS